MKVRRYLIVLIVLTTFLSQGAIAQKQNHIGIPLPVGQFSIVAQGSVAVCLNGSTLAQEP